ncbi:hypothetical protein ACSBR1_009288 [Camellia fascicularis]
MYIENERGNAPLYLAATLDSVKMSKCIAKVDCKLIGVRNNEEMTHLFLAALNGKKHAFLYLDGFCSQDDRYHYYRSNNGKTVLHSAINGEFFEKGLSPLHVMATKPSTFKSGSCLAGFDKIVYYCTFVDELKHDKVREEEEEEKKPKLPENYQTCINIFVLFRDAFCVPFGRGKDKPKQKDMERQPQENLTFPPNYQFWFEVVKLITKAMLIILGCGYDAWLGCCW